MDRRRRHSKNFMVECTKLFIFVIDGKKQQQPYTKLNEPALMAYGFQLS